MWWKRSHPGIAELFHPSASVITHRSSLDWQRKIPRWSLENACVSTFPSHSFLTATDVKWHTTGVWQRQGLEGSGGPNGPVSKETCNRGEKLKEWKDTFVCCTKMKISIEGKSGLWRIRRWDINVKDKILRIESFLSCEVACCITV